MNSTVGRTNCTRLKGILAAYTAALWILEECQIQLIFSTKFETKKHSKILLKRYPKWKLMTLKMISSIVILSCFNSKTRKLI